MSTTTIVLSLNRTTRLKYEEGGDSLEWQKAPINLILSSTVEHSTFGLFGGMRNFHMEPSLPIPLFLKKKKKKIVKPASTSKRF
jgi:hypothetical protein